MEHCISEVPGWAATYSNQCVDHGGDGITRNSVYYRRVFGAIELNEDAYPGKKSMEFVTDLFNCGYTDYFYQC